MNHYVSKFDFNESIRFQNGKIIITCLLKIIFFLRIQFSKTLSTKHLKS